MGQVQSEAVNPSSADATDAVHAGNHQRSQTSAPHDNPSQPPSMDSLIAEAVAFGHDDNNESLDAKAQKALECPCIAHLRTGPCGSQFSEAFLCFLKSTAEEKGSDCVNPFVDLQNCIKANPDAFSKDVLEDDVENSEVKEEEKPTQEYKIVPPAWSLESQSPKHRL